MVIAAGCFCGVLFIFVTTYWLIVLRPEVQAARELARRLNPAAGNHAGEPVPLLKAATPLSAVPAVEKVLRRSRGVMAPLERLIERSGLRITLGVVVLGSVFCAGAASVVLFHVTARAGMAVAGALLFG